jgi:polo-like kinase 1
MEHPFMTSNQIPKTLPRSTLACPPSKGYIEQFTTSTISNLKNSKTSG